MSFWYNLAVNMISTEQKIITLSLREILSLINYQEIAGFKLSILPIVEVIDCIKWQVHLGASADIRFVADLQGKLCIIKPTEERNHPDPQELLLSDYLPDVYGGRKTFAPGTNPKMRQKFFIDFPQSTFCGHVFDGPITQIILDTRLSKEQLQFLGAEEEWIK